MQASGGCSGGTISSAEATGSSGINSNPEQMPDISLNVAPAQQKHNHNQTQPTTQAPSKAALMSQQQAQQQQPKPAASPSYQHGSAESASSMSNSVNGSSTSGNNLVTSNHQVEEVGNHLQNTAMMYPRQPRYGHYHNQQHHTSHYQQHNHHYQHHNSNKYNNSKNNESIENHVILITVINPHYPITCDLIHQICSTYGKVNRIVIFKKNGVQAMVEFDSIESAKRAKSSLQNCDIYSGCCTLRVEIAKPVRLNVHKNDNQSFDYTNPNLASGGIQSATETGNNDHNPHHHHQQAAVAGTSHSPAFGHAGANHHARSGATNRRLGGDASSSSINSGINNTPGGGHQQASQQPLHSVESQNLKQQQQSMSSASPNQYSGHQNSAYAMGQPLEQTNTNNSEPMDTFHHQDGVFNVPRGGTGSGPSHHSNFVGIDSFMTTVHTGPHAGLPGNMYPRQDGGHHHAQHHQAHHHHHRAGMTGGIGSGSGSGSGHKHHGGGFPAVNAANSLMGGPSNLSPQGTVMMVYGLNPERINCDRLFNLFCLYGNVVRVKFLRSKEGCAMVQMGDVIAVDRCVSSLNKITLFGNELQISYSKQAFLHDVIQPFTLPDGSPSFKDFMGNKNNRFKNPEVASKNRILPPSRVLHFFNAPYGITEDELIHMFKQTAEPVSVKIFAPKVENAKSFSGLVTFGDPAQATEALVMCNHMSMPKAGAPHPYILRLCFSPPTYC